MPLPQSAPDQDTVTAFKATGGASALMSGGIVSGSISKNGRPPMGLIGRSVGVLVLVAAGRVMVKTPSMAVIVSELPVGPATGIGISIGSGMCNVCCSYLSIPVVTYSIQTGGDAIDEMVANSVGDSPVKIKAIKEEELDLTKPPKNSIEHGLHVCFDNLFSTLE